MTTSCCKTVVRAVFTQRYMYLIGAWYATPNIDILQSDESTSHREEVLDLNNVERYGPCGVMLKKCGNDAKVSPFRIFTYFLVLLPPSPNPLANNNQ